VQNVNKRTPDSHSKYLQILNYYQINYVFHQAVSPLDRRQGFRLCFGVLDTKTRYLVELLFNPKFINLVEKLGFEPVDRSGAYPEIFRGRGFEIFLYGRENLGGVLGFFS